MNEYQKKVLEARKNFLKLNKKQEKELLQIYINLSKQLSSEIASCKTTSGSNYLKKLDKIVVAHINELYANLSNTLKTNIQASSSMAGSIELAYYKSITDDVKLKAMFNRLTVSTSMKTVKKLIQGNYYADGKTLDQRIWNITKKNANDINTLIKINVARGANARRLAQQVENYVNPTKRTEAKTLEVGMNKSISYQAQRLARTSITHAFTETNVEEAKKNPFNMGLKWNLSASHYERQVKRWGEDVCDRHARQNSYDLGTGVFPPGEYPVPHPNCLCYSTTVNKNIDDAIKELKSWTKGEKNPKLDKWYEENQDIVNQNIVNQTNSSPKKETKWTDIKFKDTQFKDKKELKNHLKENYSMAFSDSTKHPINKDILQDSVNWLDKFHSYFKGFKEVDPVKLPIFKVKAGIDSVGYYRYYPNKPEAVELVLNGLYFTDKKSNMEYIEECIKTNWTVANAKGHKTFVHEYGHHVADSLKWLDKVNDVPVNQNWCKDFINDVIKDYNDLYNTNISFKDISKLVSEYGGTNPVETFAETFAEYFGGENPREFAQVFGKKVEEKLKNHIIKKR